MNRIRVSSSGVIFVAAWMLLAAGPAMAQTDFSGAWEFSPAKSKNIGMMAQLKLTATVKQSKAELTVTNVSSFNGGQEQTAETKFDLAGRPVPNKNPMEAVAETISKWDGKKLVTTWTSPGSVEGTKSVRTETRTLSDDGHTMTVESVRGKTPPMVMLFEKK